MFVLGDLRRLPNVTGPAIWLRCVVDYACWKTCTPVKPGVVPILYLPGIVARGSPCCAGDECPNESCSRSFELQYRGRSFGHQKNGKRLDRRLLFYRAPKDGLQLDVAAGSARPSEAIATQPVR